MPPRWPTAPDSPDRRVRWLLFAASFIAFAYFHQGGGWNQNGRFAMVRSLVESGRPWIDSHLVYTPGKGLPGPSIVRIPVLDGRYTIDGQEKTLSWNNVADVACTGDLAIGRGHFHPNKAPGTSIAGVPGYFVVHGIERLFGARPDDWWTFTLNAWLTSVLSVGLVSALGCVVLFDLALRFTEGRARPSLLAAGAFGFGTMYWSYGTMLYEHNLIAVSLLGSFAVLYALRPVMESADTKPRRGDSDGARARLALAGGLAGFA